eukprot:TRINITY_DN1272_c0_g1_i1.p1 TRINITY_DN1272_c0_g1~~TRINITY_DN1272_c0_g1_i1.p1  ORF type:complete len:463 (+),score=75.56 TRINITY_DN1272_c0_g1_i1:62-1390(+)
MLSVCWVGLNNHRQIWADTGCKAVLDCCILRPNPPYGYFSLGDIAMRRPVDADVGSFAIKEVMTILDSPGTGLAKPLDYEIVWQYPQYHLWIWKPIAPANFVALGVVATITPEKPSVEEVRCVRRLAVQPAVRALEADKKPLWSTNGARHDPVPCSFFRLRPIEGYSESDPERHVNKGLSSLFSVTRFTEPPTDVWVLKSSLRDLRLTVDEIEQHAAARNTCEASSSLSTSSLSSSSSSVLQQSQTSPLMIVVPTKLHNIKEESTQKGKEDGELRQGECQLRGSLTLPNSTQLYSEFPTIDTDIVDDVVFNLDGDLNQSRLVLKELVEDHTFYCDTPKGESDKSQQMIDQLKGDLEKMQQLHGEELRKMAMMCADMCIPLEKENCVLKKRIDSVRCVICMQRRRNVFVECRHFAMCDVCARSQTLCPICRSPIGEKKQVIYS